MSVSVLYDAAARRGCLLCTTSGSVFGPLFEELADPRQLERFVEERQQAGVDVRTDDADRLLAAYDRFVAAAAVETRLAFQCEHCEATFEPEEVRSIGTDDGASLFAYETPCPRCGRGDGDFAEIETCAACGEPCDDRAAHIGCANAARVVRERKPPAESVRTVKRRLKEA